MKKIVLRFLTTAVLLASAGIALAATHYVDINSTNATPPYTNWSTAAANIQDAVDAAVAGDEVVVTNGTYATGGRSNLIFAPNIQDGSRVAVDKPLSLRSVNGPQSSIIDGGQSLRCVYLTNAATLSGFTLTDGVSVWGGGGGVWCASTNEMVSNCVISGNQAWAYIDDTCGGGAHGGTLNNCTLTDNLVSWIDNDFWTSDVLTASGGGAAYSTLNNCALSRNSVNLDFRWSVAAAQGGGAAWCILNNCTLTGNSASVFSVGSPTAIRVWGGGAFQCTLSNCTLTGNSIIAEGGCTLGGCRDISGGGTYNSGLLNCILFGNSYQGICEDCYHPGKLAGINWLGEPLFVDTNGWANLRLQSNSPCINAGNNAYAVGSTDLDGNPRIAGGMVDIGAYEFQSPVSRISYAWLQKYGLPINADTDTADPDGDGVDNYHEWLAGTNPTNAFSSPAQLTITPSGIPPSGVILTWSTNAVRFILQSTTNLFSPASWVTNSSAPVVINGQNIVTNRISGTQLYYRLFQ